jgi:hypothetical protein
VVEILEGMTESETLATGWDKDFDSASVAIINHLANELNDYLSGEKNEMDSEADSEVLDPTAAGMGDSLQGGTPQGKKGVSEKDIKDLFAIDEEEIDTLMGVEKALLEVKEQRGNNGDGAGAGSKEAPGLSHRLKRRGEGIPRLNNSWIQMEQSLEA